MQLKMIKKIPTTIITGFLGSGKTTLIKYLLKNIGKKKIALIINEFGSLGIDGDLLASCNNSNCNKNDIIELTNGCICCTVAEDFIPAIKKILSHKEQYNHIVIETSGLALPQPLVQAFNWPEIKSQIIINSVVTIVDAEALANGQFAHNEQEIKNQQQKDKNIDHNLSICELFNDQLMCADIIFINKIELINKDVLKDIINKIKCKARIGTPIISNSYKDFNVNIILDQYLNIDVNTINNKSCNSLNYKIKHHDEKHHDEFKSISVNLPIIDDINQFKQVINILINEYEILRFKGFIAIKNKDMRYILQSVGPRINGYYDRMWKINEKKQSCLVIILNSKFNEYEIIKKLKQLVIL